MLIVYPEVALYRVTCHHIDSNSFEGSRRHFANCLESLKNRDRLMFMFHIESVIYEILDVFLITRERIKSHITKGIQNQIHPRKRHREGRRGTKENKKRK